MTSVKITNMAKLWFLLRTDFLKNESSHYGLIIEILYLKNHNKIFVLFLEIQFYLDTLE